MPTAEKPFELEMNPAPVCPYCGATETDAWEIDFGPGLEGNADVCCGHCGRDYRRQGSHMSNKDRGCERCQAGVIEIVTTAMMRGQSDLSAGLHCIHCGTVWSIGAEALRGQAKADVFAQIRAAPHYEEIL